LRRHSVHISRLSFALAFASAFVAMLANRGLAQEQTTATYDDWTVRCTTRAGTPPRKFCDMEQLSQLNRKEKPFSRVVISRQPVRFIVQVPVNVWLTSGIRIQIGGKDSGLRARSRAVFRVAASTPSRSRMRPSVNFSRRRRRRGLSMSMPPSGRSLTRCHSRASVRPLTRCKSNSRRGVKPQWQSAPLLR
jgi:hypothetical protein